MQAQTKRLDKSIHSSAEIIKEIRIISPPIVGVPFFARWLCGPSSRIGCPFPCRIRSMRMKRGPIHRPMISAVATAAPERKLR
jgi:hypothetical protein